MSDLEETPKKRTTQTLSEMVGVISAGAGIFAALFYLAGRSFASGYFDAMNIPHYMVTFTVWEYGEVAWLPLFLYPIVTMMLSGLLGGVIYAVVDWVLVPLWGKFITRLKKKIQVQWPKWPLPARRALIVGLNATAIFSIALFAMLTLQFVRDFGVFNGKSVVLEKAPKVEIVSVKPLALENTNIAFFQPGQNFDHYFIYGGYRLLTVNNEKYYLFREIDPVTCKPLKVYVIEAGPDKQINLSAPESLAGQCLVTINTTPIINPTVIPTSAP